MHYRQDRNHSIVTSFVSIKCFITKLGKKLFTQPLMLHYVVTKNFYKTKKNHLTVPKNAKKDITHNNFVTFPSSIACWLVEITFITDYIDSDVVVVKLKKLGLHCLWDMIYVYNNVCKLKPHRCSAVILCSFPIPDMSFFKLNRTHQGVMDVWRPL